MHFQTHEYYNCEIVLTNSRHYRVEGNWLHNQNLDHWQGWNCGAGHTRLYIDSNNNVYSGQCLNDSLGNLDQDWKLLTKPTICKQIRCTGCTDDLIVSKSEVTQ